MKFTHFLVAFLLSGCASFANFGDTNSVDKTAEVKQCSCSKNNNEPYINVSNAQFSEVRFCSNDGLRLILRSYDNFETAVLSLGDGEYKALKRAVSASGILLVGDDSEVHFKADEAVYTANGKDVSLKKCR